MVNPSENCAQLAELVKNRQILLYRSHLWLYRSHLLVALFEGLPGVQIRCRIAHWKGMEVYFPTQLEFLNWELI